MTATSSRSASDDGGSREAGVPLYRVRGVTKRYALGATRVEALRGVSLEIGVGEMVAIAGPSGSGKTTLLNLLGGLDVPDEGEVELEGLDLGRLGESRRTRLRRERLGFVFQTFNLIPVLTARENVEIPLLVAGVGRRECRARAEEVLEAVGLADRLQHRPDELSGGQRQRVAIARALVHRPAAVLADEPTGNLDSETGEAILDLLAEWNRERRITLLVATHDPRIIGRVPRRIELRDGRIQTDGPPEEAA